MSRVPNPEGIPDFRHIPEVDSNPNDIRHLVNFVVDALGVNDRSTPLSIASHAISSELFTIDLVIKELEHRDQFDELRHVLQASRDRLALIGECSDTLASIYASKKGGAR